MSFLKFDNVSFFNIRNFFNHQYLDAWCKQKDVILNICTSGIIHHETNIIAFITAPAVSVPSHRKATNIFKDAQIW